MLLKDIKNDVIIPADDEVVIVHDLQANVTDCVHVTGGR